MLNAPLSANGEAVPRQTMSQELIDALNDLRMRMNIATHLVDNLTDNVAAVQNLAPILSTLGSEELAYQVYELSGAVNRIEELLTAKS